MARRWIPRACGVVFVAGIAGLIIASINGNNAGVVLTIGLAIAISAIVLLTHGAVSGRQTIEVFEEAEMERLEAQISTLIASGAPEREVRALVRDALRIASRGGNR